MADKTRISWTEATWNVITGCSVVSPGCSNCYAMRLAGGRLQHHPSRAGLTQPTKAGPVWTGEVRFNESWLDQPLLWRRPRRIFVCAHGDLFHEAVPNEWVDRVFAVMALAPQHVFQVLTKRPERMRAYLSDEGRGEQTRIALRSAILRHDGGRLYGERSGLPWPLPNVWLGTSVEDQARADARIPWLLATPAAVRWVSAEPLLGPVSLAGSWLRLGDNGGWPFNVQPHSGLDWLVVGGESGPEARPLHPTWVRNLRDACRAARVPFFMKQLGAWVTREGGRGMTGEAEEYRRLNLSLDNRWVPSLLPGVAAALVHRFGNPNTDWSQWPADLRVREMPHGGRA